MTNLRKRLGRAQRYLRVIYLFIGQVPNIPKWSILLSMFATLLAPLFKK
jgi:hypothetical protein